MTHNLGSGSTVRQLQSAESDLPFRLGAVSGEKNFAVSILWQPSMDKEEAPKEIQWAAPTDDAWDLFE
jgi:hypothetical protein